MTPREFALLYIQERRGILRDRFYTFEWNLKAHQMSCEAMESLGMDCTDFRNAFFDVHAAFRRLYRIKAEKHLALFSQDPNPDDNRKRYLRLVRLYLDKPQNESMEEFEERFKALEAEDKPTEPAQEQPAPLEAEDKPEEPAQEQPAP